MNVDASFLAPFIFFMLSSEKSGGRGGGANDEVDTCFAKTLPRLVFAKSSAKLNMTHTLAASLLMMVEVASSIGRALSKLSQRCNSKLKGCDILSTTANIASSCALDEAEDGDASAIIPPLRRYCFL